MDLVATPMPPIGDTRRGTATLKAARDAQAGHWKSLK